MKKYIILLVLALFALASCEKEGVQMNDPPAKASQAVSVADAYGLDQVTQMWDYLQTNPDMRRSEPKGGVDTTGGVTARIGIKEQAAGPTWVPVDLSIDHGFPVLQSITMVIRCDSTVTFDTAYCQHSPDYFSKYGLWFQPFNTPAWHYLGYGFTIHKVFPHEVRFVWFSNQPLYLTLSKGYLFMIKAHGTGNIYFSTVVDEHLYSRDGQNNYPIRAINGGIVQHQ